MGAETSTCIGCGLVLPATGGQTHRYIVSSPECWATYGRVLAREYSDRRLMREAHRLSVDTYGIQHPVNHPAKSLVTHLVGVYLAVERELKSPAVLRAITVLVESDTFFPELSPPRDLGPLTVLDVERARDPNEHIDRVWAWGRSVWQAWSSAHDAIRTLGNELSS
jgi:hypothetical protein